MGADYTLPPGFESRTGLSSGKGRSREAESGLFHPGCGPRIQISVDYGRPGDLVPEIRTGPATAAALGEAH